MATSVQVNMKDRTAESTSMRIPVRPLGVTTAGPLVDFAADLEIHMAALTLLSPTGSSVNAVTRTSYTLPTDENANREMAVRVVMEDANANQASFSIPGPNLAVFPFVVGEGGDIYEWGSGSPGQALSDFALDVIAQARHPISGLTMTIKRLVLVGRNN
jgi:hypothetical protein